MNYTYANSTDVLKYFIQLSVCLEEIKILQLDQIYVKILHRSTSRHNLVFQMKIQNRFFSVLKLGAKLHCKPAYSKQEVQHCKQPPLYGMEEIYSNQLLFLAERGLVRRLASQLLLVVLKVLAKMNCINKTYMKKNEIFKPFKFTLIYFYNF